MGEARGPVTLADITVKMRSSCGFGDIEPLIDLINKNPDKIIADNGSYVVAMKTAVWNLTTSPTPNIILNMSCLEPDLAY